MEATKGANASKSLTYARWSLPVIGLGVSPGTNLRLAADPTGTAWSAHLARITTDRNFDLQGVFNDFTATERSPSTAVQPHRLSAEIILDGDPNGRQEREALQSIEFAFATLCPTVAVPLAVSLPPQTPAMWHRAPTPHDHEWWSTLEASSEHLALLPQRVAQASILASTVGHVMNRFARAHHRTAVEESIVDYVICLEGISCLGENSSEIGFKVASRTAILLRETASERKATFDNVRDLYGLRSKLVHGTGKEVRTAMRKLGDNAEAVRDCAYAMTRDVLLRVLELPELLTHEQLVLVSLTGRLPTRA